MIDSLISWTTAVLFGLITLLLGYESWALLTDHQPITDYIRPAVHTYPGLAFAIAIVIGMLLGHFLWGPPRGSSAPTGRQR